MVRLMLDADLFSPSIVRFSPWFRKSVRGYKWIHFMEFQQRARTGVCAPAKYLSSL